MADKKAPKETSFMDFFAAAKERPEQFQTGFDTLSKVNDSFGAAQRGAVRAAQDANSFADVVQGAKQAFMTPEQAATWQDIAKRAGVENKYGLAAAGLIAPMAELDIMPGPNLGVAKKQAKSVSNLGDSLQTLNKEGKILVSGGLPMSKGMKLQQAAKAEAELLKAQKAATIKPPSNVVQYKDLKHREGVKQQVVDAVKAELEQPHLRDSATPELIKERIKQKFRALMNITPKKK